MDHLQGDSSIKPHQGLMLHFTYLKTRMSELGSRVSSELARSHFKTMLANVSTLNWKSTLFSVITCINHETHRPSAGA